MKKIIKNSRGFTLVELLAVMVVLALLMGLAFYSIQGVIDNTKIGSAKATAQQYMEGVRKMLLVDKMALEEGDYYVSYRLLEKDVKSPWGTYTYYSGPDASINANLNSVGYADANATLVCGGASPTGSFIRVSKNASGDFIFYACLYDNADHYIVGSEELLNSGDRSDYHKVNSDSKVINITTGEYAS